MRREYTFLYPAPPRKQPDETSGAPHRTRITSTVSNGGSQGSRRKCEQSTRTKRLHCWDPLGSWDSARDLLSSGLAFRFLKTDVCPAALLPLSPSPLIHNLQNQIRRGPAQRLFLRMAFGASWPSGQRCKPTTGQLCLRKSNETPYTILHLWCSLWFHLKKKQKTYLLWVGIEGGVGGIGEDK